MKLKFIIVCFSLFIIIFNSFSQEHNVQKQLKDSIESIIVGELIYITYNIAEPPGDLYNVKLKLFLNGGEEIKVVPVSGEINRVNPGFGKKMVWKIATDSLNNIQNQDLNCVIYTELFSNKKNLVPINKCKAFKLSTVFPGLGTYRLSGETYHLIKGVASYGVLLGAGVYRIKASNTYAEYKDATTYGDRNMLYDNVQKEYKTARVLLYTAASLWLLEYINISLAKNKILNEKVSLSYNLDDIYNSPMVTLKVNF